MLWLAKVSGLWAWVSIWFYGIGMSYKSSLATSGDILEYQAVVNKDTNGMGLPHI